LLVAYFHLQELLMARLDVPDRPGGEAAMIWTLRPQLGAVLGVDQTCAIDI
jgi:hypothetical protein